MTARDPQQQATLRMQNAAIYADAASAAHACF